MLEIEPAPLDHRETPDLSYELVELIRPHLMGSDNMAIRFVGKGMPTTALAVLSAMTVDVAGLGTVYELRQMVFETPTGRIGTNTHIRPTKTLIGSNGEYLAMQPISNAPIYDFLEVYPNMEAAQDDLQRIVEIAHNAFRGKAKL